MANPLEKFESCSLSERLKSIRVYLSSPWISVQLRGIQKMEDFLTRNQNLSQDQKPPENELFLGMTIGAFFREEPIRSRAIRIMEDFFPHRQELVGRELEAFYKNPQGEYLRPIVKTAIELLKKDDSRHQIRTKPKSVDFFEPDYRFGLDLLKHGIYSDIFLHPNYLGDEEGEHYASFLRELCKEKEFAELLDDRPLGEMLLEVFEKAQDQFAKRRVAEFFGETALPQNDATDAFRAVLELIQPPENKVKYVDEHWQVIQAGITSAVALFATPFFQVVYDTILHFPEELTPEDIKELSEAAKQGCDEIWIPEQIRRKCLKTENMEKAYLHAEENRESLIEVLKSIFFSQDRYDGKEDFFKDINRKDVIAALGRLGDHDGLVELLKNSKQGIECTSITLIVEGWNHAMVSNLRFLSPENRERLIAHFLSLQRNRKVEEFCCNMMCKTGRVGSRDLRDNRRYLINNLGKLFLRDLAGRERRLLLKESLVYYKKLKEMYTDLLDAEDGATSLLQWLKSVLSSEPHLARFDYDDLKAAMTERLNQDSEHHESLISSVRYIELFQFLDLSKELDQTATLEEALNLIKAYLLSDFTSLWTLIFSKLSSVDIGHIDAEIDKLKEIVREILIREPDGFEHVAPLIDICQNELHLELAKASDLPNDEELMQIKALSEQQPGYSNAAILHLVRNDETLCRHYANITSRPKRLQIWLELIHREIRSIMEFPSGVHAQIGELKSRDGFDAAVINYVNDDMWFKSVPILMKPPFSRENMPVLLDLFGYLMADHRDKPQYNYQVGGLSKHVREHMSGEAAYCLYNQWAGETEVIDPELARLGWRNLLKAADYAKDNGLPPPQASISEAFMTEDVTSRMVKGLSDLSSQDNLIEKEQAKGIIPLDDFSGSHRNSRVVFACSVPDIPKMWNIVTAKPDVPPIVSDLINHNTPPEEGDTVLGRVEKSVDEALQVDLGHDLPKGICSDLKGNAITHVDRIYPFLVKGLDVRGRVLLSQEDFNVKFRDELIETYPYFEIAVIVDAVEEDRVHVRSGNIPLEIPVEEVSWGAPEPALMALETLKGTEQPVEICVTHVQDSEKACLSFKRRKPIWTLEDLALQFGTSPLKMIYVEEAENQFIFEIQPGPSESRPQSLIPPGIICRINAERLVDVKGHPYHPHIVDFAPQHGEFFEAVWELPNEEGNAEHAWQREGDPMLEIRRLAPYKYHFHDAFKPCENVLIVPADGKLWNDRSADVKIVDEKHQFEERPVDAKIDWDEVHEMLLEHINVADRTRKNAKIIRYEAGKPVVNFTTDELEENFTPGQKYPLRVIGQSRIQLKVMYPGVKSQMLIYEEQLGYSPEVTCDDFPVGQEIEAYFVGKNQQNRLLFSLIAEPKVWRSIELLRLPVECTYLGIQDRQFVWMELQSGQAIKVARECFESNPRLVVGDKICVKSSQQEGKARVERLEEGHIARLIRDQVRLSGLVVKDLNDFVLVSIRRHGLREFAGRLWKDDLPDAQDRTVVNVKIDNAQLVFDPHKLHVYFSSAESDVKGIEEIEAALRRRRGLWGKIQEWSEEGLIISIPWYDSSIRFIVPYKEISDLPSRRDPQYQKEIKNRHRQRAFRVLTIDTSRKRVELSLRRASAVDLKPEGDDRINTTTGIDRGQAVLTGVDSRGRENTYYFETAELITCRVNDSDIELTRELRDYFTRDFIGGLFSFEVRFNRLSLRSAPIEPLGHLLKSRRQLVFQCQLSKEGYYWEVEFVEQAHQIGNNVEHCLLSPLQLAPRPENQEIVPVVRDYIDRKNKIAYYRLLTEAEQERSEVISGIHLCRLVRGGLKYRVNLLAAAQSTHPKLKGMNCFLLPLHEEPKESITSVILSAVDDENGDAYFQLWDEQISQSSEMVVCIVEPQKVNQPWIAQRRNEKDMEISFNQLTAVSSLKKFGLTCPGLPLLHHESLRFKSEKYPIAFIKTQSAPPFLSFVSREPEPVVMLDQFFARYPSDSLAVFTILRNMDQQALSLAIECLPGMNYDVPLSRFESALDLKRLRLKRGDRLIVRPQRDDEISFPSFRWNVEMVITDRWVDILRLAISHRRRLGAGGVIKELSLTFLSWESHRQTLRVKYRNRSIIFPVSALCQSQRNRFFWLKEGDKLNGHLQITHENLPYSEHCVFEIDDVAYGQRHRFKESESYEEGTVAKCTIRGTTSDGFVVLFGKEDEHDGFLPASEMKMLLTTETPSTQWIDLQIPAVVIAKKDESLLSYDQFLMKHVQRFEPGSCVTGEVKNHLGNGAFIDFPGFVTFVHYQNLLHGFASQGMLPEGTKINCQVVKWNPENGEIELNHVILHKELLQSDQSASIIHRDDDGRFLIVKAQDAYGVVDRDFVPEGMWGQLTDRVLIGRVQLKTGTRLFVRRPPSRSDYKNIDWRRCCSYFPDWFDECLANIWDEAGTQSRLPYQLLCFTQKLKDHHLPDDNITVMISIARFLAGRYKFTESIPIEPRDSWSAIFGSAVQIIKKSSEFMKAGQASGLSRATSVLVAAEHLLVKHFQKKDENFWISVYEMYKFVDEELPGYASPLIGKIITACKANFRVGIEKSIEELVQRLANHFEIFIQPDWPGKDDLAFHSVERWPTGRNPLARLSLPRNIAQVEKWLTAADADAGLKTYRLHYLLACLHFISQDRRDEDKCLRLLEESRQALREEPSPQESNLWQRRIDTLHLCALFESGSLNEEEAGRKDFVEQLKAFLIEHRPEEKSELSSLSVGIALALRDYTAIEALLRNRSEDSDSLLWGLLDVFLDHRRGKYGLMATPKHQKLFSDERTEGQELPIFTID